MSLLPDIIAHSFSLCGHVDVLDGPIGYDATQLTVEITAIGKKLPPQKSHLDKNGLFCFMKTAGDVRCFCTMHTQVAILSNGNFCDRFVFFPSLLDASSFSLKFFFLYWKCFEEC